MSDMNKSNTKIIAILSGILCFTLTSGGDDSNYEQCYNVGRYRICYHRATNELLSWNESMQICDSMNSSLPFFQNWDEQMTFNNYSTYLQTKMVISNVWTCGQRHVFDNWTSVHGDIWNNYFPVQVSANGWQNQTHVILTGKAELIAEKPSKVNLHMCEYPADLCKNIETRLSLSSNTCMEIVFGHEPWYEARNKCLFKGGDLLYLNDQSEIDALRMIGEGHGGSNDHYKFWIGLRNIYWLWQTSLKEQPIEVTFTRWNHASDYERNSPTDLCIYVDTSRLKWKTSDCNEVMTVICQRRGVIEPTEDVTLSSTSSTTESITNQNQSDGTNYVIFGSVIGFVALLCVASITIAVLIVKRKSSVAGENTQDDKRYQGLKTAQTYSDRNVYDNNYDTIDTDNEHYEDIANLASDSNYESIDDAPYLELVDTEVYDNLEEEGDAPYLELVDAGDDTEADRSSQLENVTEEKV